MFLILKPYFNKNMLHNDQEWIEGCRCLKLSCIQSLTPGISPCLILAFPTFWCFGFFSAFLKVLNSFSSKNGTWASHVLQVVVKWCPVLEWSGCATAQWNQHPRGALHMALKLRFCDFRGGGVKMWDKLCLLIPLSAEVFGVCVQGWRGSHCCTETRSWL